MRLTAFFWGWSARHNVVISIPLGTDTAPEVLHVDGIHRHDVKTRCIEWVVDVIDGNNRSGTMEFNVTQRDEDVLFPIAVHFVSPTTVCGAGVSNILDAESNAAIKFSHSRVLKVDKFVVE